MLNSNAWPRDLSSNVRFEMYRNANQLRTKKCLDFRVSKIFFIEINMDIWNAAQMIEKFITKSTKNTEVLLVTSNKKGHCRNEPR